MMNVLAISLIISSLAGAGLFSPPTEKQNHQSSRDDVLVKEGHRVIVVEYEREALQHPNLSPSPPSLEPKPKPKPKRSISSQVLENTKEKIKQASSSVLPNLDQSPPHDPSSSTPKDLITETLDNTKESVFEKNAQEIEEKRKEAADATNKAVEDLKSKEKMANEAASDDKSVQRKTVELFKEGWRDFSEILRRGFEVGYDAAKYVISWEVVGPLMGVVHLLGFATAYGIGVWVTFVSSHVLAGGLPRQQFGVLQSKIYPVYFKVMVGSIGYALLGHSVSQRLLFLRIRECHVATFQGYILLASIGLVLINLLYLEPRATKVMFDKMKLEKEEGRGRSEDPLPTESTVGASNPSSVGANKSSGDADVISNPRRVGEREEIRCRMWTLNERLKRLNTLSSLLNVLTLTTLTWHLVYLGLRLYASP